MHYILSIFITLSLTLSFVKMSFAIPAPSAFQAIGTVSNSTNPAAWESHTLDLTAFFPSLTTAHLTFDLINDVAGFSLVPNTPTTARLYLASENAQYFINFEWISGLSSSHFRNVRLTIDGLLYIDQYGAFNNHLGDAALGTAWDGLDDGFNILGETGFAARTYVLVRVSPLNISPSVGGDTGLVSVRILGDGFIEGTTVRLVRDGESDIIGNLVKVDASGRTLATTFDLTGKTRGAWDVVVTNPDGTSFLLSNGFTIEEGRAPQVWVDILGLNIFRPGLARSFWISYGNRGNVNAIGVPLWIAGIPKNATFTLNFDIAPPPVLAGQESIDWNQIPVHIETDADIVVPLIIPQIPPGHTGSLSITLNIPAPAEPLHLQAWTNPPLFSSPISSDFVDCILDLIGTAIDIIDIISPLSCAFSVAEPLFDLFITGENVLSKGIQSTLWWLTSVIRACVPGLATISDAADLAAFVVNNLLNVTEPFSSCRAAFDQSSSSELSAQPVTSVDPNAKIGSQGAGAGQYLSGNEPLRYAIFFENLNTATAPAQEVFITDQLDAAQMDLSTLSLGTITFGGTQVNPPQGLSTFTRDVDLRPGKNLMVRVTAGLNPATGILTWRLTSLDPATGELPVDPLAGFLPPNINPPEGEGSVLVTIMPKAGLPTGTEIRNRASIVFDVNPPIDTPEWVNLLDNSTPTSQVLPLTPVQTTTKFEVQWAGTDAESGIKDYTIFVSEDSAPFVVWLHNTPNTSATFSGENGKTYAFYSVARDQTGNIEVKDPVAEAVTQITVSPALVITATTTGSPSPPTATFPDTVTNGDFLIRGHSNRSNVGDGRNETTTWVFDFTLDPDFSSAPASAPIESALLTLTLEPKAPLINTDSVRIRGLRKIITPLIQGLPVGVTTTIQIELLDFYSADEIRQAITRRPHGHIRMVYSDDAIISFAQLELSISIPE
jgi:hypothetical protein